MRSLEKLPTWHRLPRVADRIRMSAIRFVLRERVHQIAITTERHVYLERHRTAGAAKTAICSWSERVTSTYPAPSWSVGGEKRNRALS